MVGIGTGLAAAVRQRAFGLDDLGDQLLQRRFVGRSRDDDAVAVEAGLGKNGSLVGDIRQGNLLLLEAQVGEDAAG